MQEIKEMPGWRRVLPWQKLDWASTRVLRFLASTIEGGMLARNRKTYMRNRRRYYDNLRPLIALTSYFKDAKEFELMWGLFQEFSS